MNANEDVNEITPSKKKLKQARLPFKTISDSVITSDTPPFRKRKLSTDYVEKESKIGKLNKQDNNCSELVIISDDESNDAGDRERENCKINPLVKLVDNVWKKKQKSKATKQSKKMKHKTPIGVPNTCANNKVDKKQNDYDKVQAMEIDEPGKTILVDQNERTENIVDTAVTDKTSKDSNIILQNDGSKNSNVPNTSNVHTITLDEDSNSLLSLEKQNSLVFKDNNNCVVLQNDKCENLVIQNDADMNAITFDKDCNDSLKSEKQGRIIVTDDKLEMSGKNNLTSIATTSVELKNLNKSEVSSDSTNTKTEDNETILSIENSNLKALNVEVSPSSQEKKLEKSNSKDEVNTSFNSSKLGDSSSSNLSTPRRSKRGSDNSKSSLNDSTGLLTPKQLQRKQEFAKKRLEREQEKQIREQRKQQEKEERQRLKKEKEELKKKEKDEKEEQKKREREEKERQKELEKKLREEKEEKKRKEKEEKEEQKRKEKEAKEDEKRKKQEAMEQEKQEQELKKKKAAEAFANFFVPKQKVEKDQEHILVSKSSMLSSFTKKADMRLAPIVRAQLDTDQQMELDKQMELQNFMDKDLYLNNLKVGVLKPKSNGKTWPLDDKNDEDDDVMIIEDELPPLDSANEVIESEPTIREKLRPKLLSFHENRRPPYWGTWRKNSIFIKPRRPFGQDEKQLDYEVDSDEEWEEEEGESISGSVAGSDEELNEADEYEVDNELFVPHGYLSDEEATMDEDDVLSLSPETQKARLRQLEDEFELELKKPTEKLKTRLYGPLWENSDGGKPELCIESLWNYFSKMAMVVSDPTPLLQPSNDSEETEKKKSKKKKSQIEGEPTTPKTKKKKPKKLGTNKETNEVEVKNIQSDSKKSQPGINAFLKKIT